MMRPPVGSTWAHFRTWIATAAHQTRTKRKRLVARVDFPLPWLHLETCNWPRKIKPTSSTQQTYSLSSFEREADAVQNRRKIWRIFHLQIFDDQQIIVACTGRPIGGRTVGFDECRRFLNFPSGFMHMECKIQT
jgi:hypothetical protein